MSRLRVGVIGAGSWAVAAHIPALEAHRDEIELVGVSRLGREPLERIRDEHGFAMASEDYRDVLAAGIDLAVIASPSAHHAEQATAAVEAGAHVLCEKPFTLTSTDAWAVVEAARRHRRHLLVSFGWNFAPMVRRTMALLDDYPIGEIEYLSIAMSSQTRELLSDTGAYPDASPETVPEQRTWTDASVSGGGYGQAQLSHALALGLGLTDTRVDGAFAIMSAPNDQKVELHDAISLRLTSGGIAAVGGGSSHPGADGNRHHLAVEAIGHAGQFSIDVFGERVSLYRPDIGHRDLQVSPGEGAYDGHLAVKCLLDLATGRSDVNPAPGELGARTVEALELAYRSARSGTFETEVRQSDAPQMKAVQ